MCLTQFKSILRLQEICQSPSLFPDNISLGHAKQGLLGDCWVLCACTFLLKNQLLLNKVEQQVNCGQQSVHVIRLLFALTV